MKRLDKLTKITTNDSTKADKPAKGGAKTAGKKKGKKRKAGSDDDDY